MRHRIQKFDGDSGEMPPIKIGQLVVADDGSLYDAIQNISKEDAEDLLRDREVIFPEDLREEVRDAINAVFTGSVIGRTDSIIRLKKISTDESNGEVKEFASNDVIMVLPITTAEIKTKTLGWLEEMFDGMMQAMFDIIIESESKRDNKEDGEEL
ncbi:MAG: hypothetical protein CMA83_01360 [Euryarchaeota archaeon]|nr:hypothetical protein [Euryarchaeota archaeon]